MGLTKGACLVPGSCQIWPDPQCHAALTRRVAPRLIVGGEDPKVAATDELLIVHGQQGAGGGQELRVENNLAARKDSAEAPDLSEVPE